MDNIDHGNPLMRQGREVRDRLKLTGENPEILRKLDHLVDEMYINSALAEKLKRLIAKVE